MENDDCGIMRRSQVFYEGDPAEDKCMIEALNAVMIRPGHGDRLKSLLIMIRRTGV